MELNSIQVAIFNNLSNEAGLDVDSYISRYSMEFIGISKKSLVELSKQEGDIWINKAYVASLEDIDIG